MLDRQPRGAPLYVDWENPITAGLIQAFSGVEQYDAAVQEGYNRVGNAIQRDEALEFSSASAGLARLVHPNEKTQSYTIAVLAKKINTATAYAMLSGIMYDAAGNPPYGDQIDLDGNGNELRFAFSLNGNALAIQGYAPISSVDYEWIFATLTSGNQALYKNNIKLAESYNTGTVYYTDTSQIGVGNINGDGRNVNALIKAAFRWDHVLTAAEMKEVTNNCWAIFKEEDSITESEPFILGLFNTISGIVSGIGNVVSSSSVASIGRRIAQTLGLVSATSNVGASGRRIAVTKGNASSITNAVAIGRRVTSANGVSITTSVATGYAQRITKTNGVSVSTTGVNAVGRSVRTSIGTATSYSIVQGYNTTSKIASGVGSVVSTSLAVAIGRAIRKTVGVSFGYSNVQGYNLAATIKSGTGLIVSGSTASAIGRMVKSRTGQSVSQTSVVGYAVRFVASNGTAASYSDIRGYTNVIRKAVGYTNGNTTVRAYSYVESSIRISLKVVLPKVVRKGLPVVLKATKPY